MNSAPLQDARATLRKWEWALLALALVAIRGPLWLLPGLGRDEATYAVWAYHPHPAYAPLLQAMLIVPRVLGADAAWMWRWPSIVSGMVVLLLFERWMAACGAARGARVLALVLFAFSPWQTYTGAILHPDDLQLTAIFAFAWASRTGHTRVALVAAALAPWAKPSGVIVTAIALLWRLRAGRPSARSVATWVLVLVVAFAPLGFAHPGLVTAMMSFGKVVAPTPLLERIAVLLLGVVFLAGPGAWVGLARGLWHAPRLDLRVAPDRLLGLALLGAFALAAAFSGQVKGNWLLPGLFLLWPMGLVPRTRWRPRAGWNVAIGASVLLSTALTLVFARPDLARWAEERWGRAILPSYLTVAGTREAEVASATQWWQRPAEYRSLAPWCEEVWPPQPIEVVVSDDYGLAAQWAMTCPTSVPRLVLPRDTLLPRPRTIPAGALVIAVQCDVADLVGAAGWIELDPLPHPVTGAPVHRALAIDGIVLPPRVHPIPSPRIPR